MNVWKGTQKCAAGACFNACSTTTFPSNLSLMAPLPVMATQLSKIEHLRALCLVTDNILQQHPPFFLCVNTVFLILECNFDPQKLRMFHKSQHTSDLLNLPSRWPYNPYSPLQMTSRSWRSGNQPPHRIWRKGQLEWLLYICWDSHFRQEPPCPRQSTKDGRKTGGDFRKIIQASWWPRQQQRDKGHRNKRRRRG